MKERIQRQIWEYQKLMPIYNFNSTIDLGGKNKISKINISSYYPLNNTQKKLIDNKDKYIYYICLYEEYNMCTYCINYLSFNYNELSSLIASNKMNEYFRMLLYDNIPIMETPIYFEIFNLVFYSFNKFKILEKMYEICGDELS